MAKVPAADVVELNRTDSTSGEKATYISSISHRSSSVKPSMRSSRSRITLVGYDEDLEYKLDTAYGTTSKVKDFTWLDHLLGIFCIKRGGRVSLAMTAMPRKPEEDEDIRPSPWIVPVYVLSSQKDESRHFISKEAKCTIDTGNLQGNLVSKAFVTDVLGYLESQFQPLTKAEEAGGTGVTGHKLIPQGAISLTWYHSNSTRVFRDMRFLISEHPMYDLILGSRSIHQNRILDVPNLAHLIDDGVERGAEKLEDLLDKVNGLKEDFAEMQDKMEDKKSPKGPEFPEQYRKMEEALKTAVRKYDVENRNFQQRRYWNSHKKGAKQEELDQLIEEWRQAFPLEKEIPPLKKD